MKSQTRLLAIALAGALLLLACSMGGVVPTTPPPKTPEPGVTTVPVESPTVQVEPPVGQAVDLTGTRWRISYVDPVTEQYREFDLIFNPGGVLRNTHPNDTTPDNDTWEQFNTTVVIRFNNNYATYTAEIDGDNMLGTAININDVRWPWEAYRLP